MLGLAALAGCTGSTDPGPLFVASRSFRFVAPTEATKSSAASASGTSADTAKASAARPSAPGAEHLLVTTVVSNVSDAAHSGMLVFTPRINGETRTRRVAFTLDAHATRSFEAAYPDVTRSSAPSLSMHSSLHDVR